MNLLHIKPWGDNAQGVPTDYPLEVREHQEGKPVPDGWFALPREEYDAYLAARPVTIEKPVLAVETPRWRVSKDTLISRVVAAGRLADVMAALAAQSAEDQFVWNQSAWFWSDNPRIRGICTALNLDAEAMLAPDDFIQ